MIRCSLAGLFFCGTLCFALLCQANTAIDQSQATSQPTGLIPNLHIKGAIGPATSDYLIREITQANNSTETIPLIVITLDTPGGLSASLRDINKRILSSNIPIACLVYPQGARAASAGTYILYACHIAAMSETTTLGAATPVNISAPLGSGDKEKPQNADPTAMEKKVLNDAIAYIRSLAQLRGRNEEWAELAVTEAATLTAREALAENVINIIASSPQDLISRLDGTELSFNQQLITLQLSDAQLVAKAPDWRNHFIATITNPNIAYILMLIGIYGLILEFYSPGIGIAGVTGAISLLIALYAFQLLPLNYAGAGLLLIGIGLLIVESMVASFGVFGIGGIIAFVIGSIFLIDTDLQQFKVSLPLIAAVSAFSTMFFVFSLSLLWRARKNKVVSGQEEIIGAQVAVIEDITGKTYAMFNGERWAIESRQPLQHGQQVQIEAIEGLTLYVTPTNLKEQNDGTAI